MMIAPACSRRVTRGEFLDVKPTRLFDPFVVGSDDVRYVSLRMAGTPNRGFDVKIAAP